MPGINALWNLLRHSDIWNWPIELLNWPQLIELISSGGEAVLNWKQLYGQVTSRRKTRTNLLKRHRKKQWEGQFWVKLSNVWLHWVEIGWMLARCQSFFFSGCQKWFNSASYFNLSHKAPLCSVVCFNFPNTSQKKSTFTFSWSSYFPNPTHFRSNFLELLSCHNCPRGGWNAQKSLLERQVQ